MRNKIIAVFLIFAVIGVGGYFAIPKLIDALDSKNTSSIVFNTSGGSSKSDIVYNHKKSDQIISVGIASHPDFEFSKWIIEGEANGATVSGQFLRLPANFSGDILLKAVWEITPYTLTLEINAGIYSIIYNTDSGWTKTNDNTYKKEIAVDTENFNFLEIGNLPTWTGYFKDQRTNIETYAVVDYLLQDITNIKIESTTKIKDLIEPGIKTITINTVYI